MAINIIEEFEANQKISKNRNWTCNFNCQKWKLLDPQLAS
jgi:hypothetical protein